MYSTSLFERLPSPLHTHKHRTIIHSPIVQHQDPWLRAIHPFQEDGFVCWDVSPSTATSVWGHPDRVLQSLVVKEGEDISVLVQHFLCGHACHATTGRIPGREHVSRVCDLCYFGSCTPIILMTFTYSVVLYLTQLQYNAPTNCLYNNYWHVHVHCIHGPILHSQSGAWREALKTPTQPESSGCSHSRHRHSRAHGDSE